LRTSALDKYTEKDEAYIWLFDYNKQFKVVCTAVIQMILN